MGRTQGEREAAERKKKEEEAAVERKAVEDEEVSLCCFTSPQGQCYVCRSIVKS